MKIGILGSGDVGRRLADGLVIRRGKEITIKTIKVSQSIGKLVKVSYK